MIRHILAFAFALVLAALLAGCGGNDTPRGAFDASRAAWRSNDYANLLQTLSKPTRDRLGNTQDKLRAELPTIDAVKKSVDALVNAMPAKTKTELDGKSLFERLNAAVSFAKANGKKFESIKPEQLPLVRAFAMPDEEVGKLVENQQQGDRGYLMRIRFPDGDTFDLPCAKEQDGPWRLSLPAPRR